MPSHPFLLTDEGTVDPWWLHNWPVGGVALVLGGSVDIRKVRKEVKKPLRSQDVSIHILHATLWGEKFRKFKPKGRFLLLATETLFRKKYSSLRNMLWVVFDMCEKHERQTPQIHTTEMDFLRQFGHCEVQVTVDITRGEQKRRKDLLFDENSGRCRYRPKREVNDDSMADTNLLDCEIWRICGCEDFVGFPLPGVHPDDAFWDYLFGWSTDRGTFQTHSEDRLGFNSLPINFLLREATSGNQPQKRLAAILMVAAVQLVSSRGFAPVFQHGRTLAFDSHTVWDMTETAVFLDCFLTGGGRWSKEATLTSLAWQYVFQRRQCVWELRNLDGRTVQDYLDGEVELRWKLQSLLEELLRIMDDFHLRLRDELKAWCEKWNLPHLSDDPSILDAPHGPSGEVLEKVMQQAATKAHRVHTPDDVPPFNFVVPMCEIRRPRWLRLAEEPNGHFEVRFDGDSSAFERVHRRHFPGKGGVQGRIFNPDSQKGKRLLASVMFLNLLLDHDQDLDEEEWWQWQLHRWHVREDPQVMYKFQQCAHGSSGQCTIRFPTTPMGFFAPGASSRFGKQKIYVLKRFATPDLLVLSSYILAESE